MFEVPAGYTVLGAGRSEPLRDEDDDLLQFAIQQSLLDAGTETDQVGTEPRPRLTTPTSAEGGRPRLHGTGPAPSAPPYPAGDHLGGADQHPPGRRPAPL